MYESKYKIRKSNAKDNNDIKCDILKIRLSSDHKRRSKMAAYVRSVLIGRPLVTSALIGWHVTTQKRRYFRFELGLWWMKVSFGYFFLAKTDVCLVVFYWEYCFCGHLCIVSVKNLSNYAGISYFFKCYTNCLKIILVLHGWDWPDFTKYSFKLPQFDTFDFFQVLLQY